VSGTIANLNGVFFHDPLHGVVVGNSGTMLRTTNAGAEWHTMDSAPSTCQLNAIVFPTTDHGLLASALNADGGPLFRTTNGGLRWAPCLPAVTGTLYCAASNGTTSFVGGMASLSFGTRDGGVNWEQLFQTGCGEPDIYGIAFSGLLSAATVGSRGLVRETTDGGDSWTSVVATGNTLRGIAFSAAGTGLLVGEYGTILRSAGNATGVDMPPRTSTAFLLEPNSPNPFSSRTSLGYALPLSGFVSLRVYSATGRLAAVLVDDMQRAGRHSATWNAGGQPAGMYFAVLRASGRCEVRKLLLTP
jgi:photosystem II stability/assembly factor-like uncharacterized protein